MGLFQAIKDSDLEHIKNLFKIIPKDEHCWFFHEIKFDGSENGIHHAPKLLEWVKEQENDT